MKIIDQTFQWKGFGYPRFEHGKWDSFCRLRIYRGDAGAVVVVTDIDDRAEYPDGTGTSITNSAENVARLVVEQFQLDPRGFVWLEHYPDAAGKETIARVEFEYAPNDPDGLTFKRPRWSHITREQAVELTNDPEL